MKKKLSLLLTFVIGFLLFSNVGEAAKYNENNVYSCTQEGYSLSVSEDKTLVYCCPEGYTAAKHGNEEGCFKSTKKSVKGGSNYVGECGSIGNYKTYGNSAYCYKGQPEPIFNVTFTNLDKDDVIRTCKPGNYTGGSCKIKEFPLPLNMKNFLGYSKSSNCNVIDYVVGEFPDEEDALGLSKLYACYAGGMSPSTDTYESCGKLLDPDIIDFINDIMGWIRIIVPILLIVFGTLDFTKATFAGKEEDMHKCRERFIKRIVAAVIVFLIPTFINVLLKEANKVWDIINPDTCIR